MSKKRCTKSDIIELSTTVLGFPMVVFIWRKNDNFRRSIKN
nr:MAG TPA: hypothetical protein [Caudoviricetes sp.]